ncbi:hypothetical protein HK101_010115 [Irineochytrium annulatum]|nr:hypothetical protein HK101_010115 [Irineochytrium annulatum]
MNGDSTAFKSGRRYSLGPALKSKGDSMHFVDQKLTPKEMHLLAGRAFFMNEVLALERLEDEEMAAKGRTMARMTLRDQQDEDDVDLFDESDIVVCTRTRPILPHEVERGIYSSLTVDPTGKTARLHLLDDNVVGARVVKRKDFTVDAAFGDDATNESVYEKTARNLIPLVLGGGVGALFAYGQTGSGKTFTMTAIEKLIARDLFGFAETYGSNSPAAVASVLDSSATLAPLESQFEIYVSFFEIIGNQAKDLLSPGLPGEVSILEDVFGQVQVKGAIEELVTRPEELRDLIERGAALRRTEGTAKNATSSRSHAVCRIRIKNLRMKAAEDGLMYLLDLAGSEGAADSRYHDKERIQEGVEINKSLATLKDCIRNRAMAATSGKHVHIPYRNSKVTLLLKDAFELSSARLCKTVVIAALNPSILDATQSLNTLRYIGPLKVAAPPRSGPLDPDDPSAWSNETLRAWVRATSKVANCEILCPTESGKQVLRIPEGEFIERCLQCGMGEKAAKAFYLKLWNMLIVARNKKRIEKMGAARVVRRIPGAVPKNTRLGAYK